MGKKIIQGNLEVRGSVEASPIESTSIHIKEVPSFRPQPSGIATSASVDQTASDITFNSSTSTREHSTSRSTSLTYSGIEMTRIEKKIELGEETTDNYKIQFPLKSGTLALTTDSKYTLEEPQGSSWVRIAKLTDPKVVSKGLVSLKPSGIRLDTYYNPIKDFTPETVLSAGTSYRFRVNYDYTDHIDTISGQGLNLKVTAGGSEAEITDNHTPKNFWGELTEVKYLEIGELYRPDDSVVGYNTTAWDYVDGDATLVFTNLSESPLEVFIVQDASSIEVENNIENYNKVLVQPQETVNLDLEDQNTNLDLYIYNSNSEDVYMSCTYKLVGGRGRTTTNYATITPETDIQVKDILVQASVENFDYFVTSLEQIRVEEVPVNFPYVQFKAVYDPLNNRADVNPILVSSGNAGITDISWGGTGSGDDYSSISGSSPSSYSEASEVSENEIDLTETGEEETTEETITEETTNETTDSISSDEPVVTSDSGDSSGGEYMDSGSSSGANAYDFGFKAATFECYDGQVYLDVLLHHPATNNYKDFNLTSTLEEAENLELLEEIVPHDLEAVLDRQLLEGSTFEKGVNYEFIISANYQDYIDAISQNKEINITYTPTTTEGEDLDPATILKYNSEEFIILDCDWFNQFGAEYPDHIIFSTGYNQWDPTISLQTSFAQHISYVYYTKLAGTAEITFHRPDAYSDVTAEALQEYIKQNHGESIKVIHYEVLESSEDRSSITFSFKLEGCFSDFNIDWFLGLIAIDSNSYSAGILTIDPAETEFCLKLPFTPEETVIFDRYSIDNNDAYNFQLRVNNILKSQTCEQFDLYSPQAAIRALDRAVSELNTSIDNIESDINSIESDIRYLNNKINDQTSFDKTFYTGITKTTIDLRRYLDDYNNEVDKFNALYEFITSKQGLVRTCCVDDDGNIVAYDLVAENNEIKFNKYEAGYNFYWYISADNKYVNIGGSYSYYCYIVYEGTDPEFLDFFNIKIPLHYNSPITKDLQDNKQDKILSTPNITVDTSASFVIPNVNTLFTEENYHEAPTLFTFNSNLYFMQLNVDSSSCLTFSSNKPFSLTSTENLIYDGTLEYFAADVSDWTPVQVGTPIKSLNNKIYLRGKGNTYCRHSDTPKDSAYGSSYSRLGTVCFNLIGTNVSCDGNIEALLDWETAKHGNHPTMGNWCFRGLFNKCSALIKAPDLPATTLSHGCYSTMFSKCNLIEAPELPALKMAPWCYAGMFAYTYIKTAPVLASTELATGCYNAMFDVCSNLTEAPELPAMKVPTHAYNCMFADCLSLTEAPELPATDLGGSCYMYMFQSCSRLTKAPTVLPATNAPGYTYFQMFSHCSSLTEAPEILATALGFETCRRMFSGTQITTPPSLLAESYVPYYAYEAMFSGCNLVHFPAIKATTFGLEAIGNTLGIRNIKLSTTPTEECPYEFRIPWGTATATAIHDAGHIRPDIAYENPGDYLYPLDGMSVTDTTTGKSIDAALNTTYYANIPTVE